MPRRRSILSLLRKLPAVDNAVIDVGFGLRYYLENFVVRFDTGWSNEDSGIYFHFGQVF